MQDPRASGGEAMPTKRSVPSCSALPNVWSPQMDRYIVRLVTLDKVRPHHLAKVMKNHFPELNYVSTLLPSRHRYYLLLGCNARKQSDAFPSMPSQRML